MNHLLVALVVFICLFSSTLLGWFVRDRLPSHHLSDDSISVVKLATGLIATMAALVLGLLVSSAKGTFDSTGAELLQTAAKVAQFDGVLAGYGSETQDIRSQLKANFTGVVQVLESRDATQMKRLNSAEAIHRSEDLQSKVQALVPTNDSQRALKARALQIMDEVFSARWLTLLQANGSVPVTLLAVLVAWLAIIFGTFGLFSPRNGTVLAVLMMCALSTSGAIVLVEELNRPLDGLIGVSLEPMRDILARLGQ